MRSENLWNQIFDTKRKCKKPKPADLHLQAGVAYSRMHWLYRFFVSNF